MTSEVSQLSSYQSESDTKYNALYQQAQDKLKESGRIYQDTLMKCNDMKQQNIKLQNDLNRFKEQKEADNT